MKERPILFKGAMVRAILDGTKTQTRRLVKPAPPAAFDLLTHRSDAGWVYAADYSKLEWENAQRIRWECPYGQPGDRLWVRESWMPDPPADGTWNYTSWAGCRDGQIAAVPEKFRHPRFCNYAATWPHDLPVRWTPSIHMPRWASRITLEITGVRVERLQDISEADAIAEGCTQNHNGYFWGGPHAVSGLKQMATAVGAYRDLWESINGADSWAANPWVWVVDFKRIEVPA